MHAAPSVLTPLCGALPALLIPAVQPSQRHLQCAPPDRRPPPAGPALRQGAAVCLRSARACCLPSPLECCWFVCKAVAAHWAAERPRLRLAADVAPSCA